MKRYSLVGGLITFPFIFIELGVCIVLILWHGFITSTIPPLNNILYLPDLFIFATIYDLHNIPFIFNIIALIKKTRIKYSTVFKNLIFCFS